MGGREKESDHLSSVSVIGNKDRSLAALGSITFFHGLYCLLAHSPTGLESPLSEGELTSVFLAIY